MKHFITSGLLYPLSVIKQLVELLAFNGNLLDTLPVEKMKEAETALPATSTTLADDMQQRLFSERLQQYN